MKIDYKTIVSAMLLIAGACVGGGMLALPIATGLSGFIPSTITMLVCWLVMTATGLLLIEASLWLDEGAHYISMSETFLGKWGKITTWILYLFIGYASLIAYTAGGGLEIVRTLSYFTPINCSKFTGCLLFFILFGIVIDLGTKIVGRVNSVLFFGMIVSYVLLVFTGIPDLNPEYLAYKNWNFSYMAIPLLLTAFSYQTLAPSLTPYLKRDVKALRIAVIGGTTLALVIYLFWQILILGSIPAEGTQSLTAALAKGEPATFFLESQTNGKWISNIANFFSFFAIVTSFLGIGLGLFDFLSDGLHISKVGWGKLKLGLLIAIPTIYFAAYYEQVFLYAMDLSGGFGDTVISGMFPVMMVWIGRYVYKKEGIRLVPGGKVVLSSIFLFFALSLLIECLVQLGWIPSLFDVNETYLL